MTKSAASSSKSLDVATSLERKVVAIYARVSTGRQAEEGVSLDSQLSAARRYAEKEGHLVGREFIESKSAKADNRPVLQEMMREATSPAKPFDIILFHSLSRAFRNEIDFVVYKRKLEKHGVEIRSLTQDFGVGKHAEMAMRFVAIVDESRLDETAAHVHHSMVENAKQGYANGSVPPLGYVSKVVEQRGDKFKKKWAIDEKGAQLVRKVFDLCINGDGANGPMGVTKIRQWLNAHSYLTPRGNQFFDGVVHKILTNETYLGVAIFNRKNSRDQTVRPESEWVKVPVPAIISKDVFHKAQAVLAKRRPNVTAPRTTSSDILLGGIAFCAVCGARMKIRTGQKKTGTFRYYTCSKHLQLAACPGGTSTSIRMELLDKSVVDAVTDSILTPERFRAIVAEAAKLREGGKKDAVESVSRLRGQLSDIDRKMRRLVVAIEDGIGDIDMIRQRTKELSEERGHVSHLIETQSKIAEQAIRPISLDQAKQAVATFKKRLSDAPPAIKKRYLQSLVAQVAVGRDKIDIMAAKSTVAESLNRDFSDKTPPSGGVRTFERNWWARQDSNLRPNRYERRACKRKTAETLTFSCNRVEFRSTQFQGLSRNCVPIACHEFYSSARPLRQQLILVGKGTDNPTPEILKRAASVFGAS